MAKEKRSAADADVPAGKPSPRRSAADLDAELAALEAELAALEGKPKKKAEKPAKKQEAPAPAPTPRAPEPEPAKEKKGRFSMPKLGKKKAEEPAPPAAATAAPAPALAPEPAAAPPDTPVSELAVAPQKAFSPEPEYDLSLWRQEGDAWIRVVPETPLPVMRRVLDENGGVVREESADKRDVDSVSSVRAERGLGRLLRRKG